MIPWLTIELTNRCNYDCHFCGRHKARKAGTMELGDMDIKLFQHILTQYRGDIIQFNKDGETLLYPHLWKVGYLCRQANKITNIVTNGLLLNERAETVIEFDTVCVSVHKDDPQQFESVKSFVESYTTPVVIKLLGDYDNPEYRKLGLKTTRRRIHAPAGDFAYQTTKDLPLPELGICLDLLMKPSINWKGDFSICNRYDPDKLGVIGDCNIHTLKKIWNSEERQEIVFNHIIGQREKVPFCAKCQFYGVPVL